FVASVNSGKKPAKVRTDFCKKQPLPENRLPSHSHLTSKRYNAASRQTWQTCGRTRTPEPEPEKNWLTLHPMKQPVTEPKNFASQIRFALENYTPHGINKNSLNAVLVCGTGGSGIAGRIVRNYFQDKLDLPISTVAGYLLPRYAGAGSLAIVWSYSGENEEALALYDIARERGCRVIVISSGGRLVEKAREDAEKAGEGEILLYPVEAATTSNQALGYAL